MLEMRISASASPMGMDSISVMKNSLRVTRAPADMGPKSEITYSINWPSVWHRSYQKPATGTGRAPEGVFTTIFQHRIVVAKKTGNARHCRCSTLKRISA